MILSSFHSASASSHSSCPAGVRPTRVISARKSAMFFWPQPGSVHRQRVVGTCPTGMHIFFEKLPPSRCCIRQSRKHSASSTWYSYMLCVPPSGQYTKWGVGSCRGVPSGATTLPFRSYLGLRARARSSSSLRFASNLAVASRSMAARWDAVSWIQSGCRNSSSFLTGIYSSRCLITSGAWWLSL